jgi:peptidyl-tRNA hydrolase
MLSSHVQKMLEARRQTMAAFSADYRPLNMYALYRADLQMSPGKLAAQCGHAFALAYEAALAHDAALCNEYKGTGNGTKICMYAKNQGQLLRAYEEIKAMGVPHALVIDRGHVLPPHFSGEPIITALGIGPAYADELRPILKRYTLAP